KRDEMRMNHHRALASCFSKISFRKTATHFSGSCFSATDVMHPSHLRCHATSTSGSKSGSRRHSTARGRLPHPLPRIIRPPLAPFLHQRLEVVVAAFGQHDAHGGE